jgi:ParB family chromosome partitioning protein
MREDGMNRKRGLGRGLSALMSDVREEAAPPPGAAPKRPDLRVPVEKIRPNPDQPRRSFNREALEELAASVREKGIIQPIIVRENPKGSDSYEIVAGERRWRAAQMARLHEVPVLVRDLDDTEVIELAIIENIQRADLNPIEEAQGYRQLMDRFGHTQEKLAEALGKSRSHIANLLRLLTLPDEVLGYLRDGRLSAGHARALVVLEDPLPLARKVVAEGLTVREVERLAKAPETARPRPVPKAPAKDADTRALEGELSANLGMPVVIDHRPGAEGGAVTIRFSSLEQLDDLCRVLSATTLAGSR